MRSGLKYLLANNDSEGIIEHFDAIYKFLVARAKWFKYPEFKNLKDAMLVKI